MSHKMIITLLVCVATVPGVVYSAPNRNEPEVTPHRTEAVLAVTNLPSSVAKPSNELERTQQNGQGSHEIQPVRTKRAIIFRPLFVYRQQEIKKQKLKEMREQNQQQQQQQQQQQSAACAACHQQHRPTPKPVRHYAQNYPYQRW